ncbi:MAG: hypothetical protein U0791_04310 [Gemmataceae bacterium]
MPWNRPCSAASIRCFPSCDTAASVATMAIGKAGAKNAGLFAAAMLNESTRDPRCTGRPRWLDPRRARPSGPAFLDSILGGGQLGPDIGPRGHPLGIRSPCSTRPPNRVQPRFVPIRGEFDDLQALYKLVQESDVVTYEFENVPVESARWLAERVPVFPPPGNEFRKTGSARKPSSSLLNIATPPFAAIDDRNSILRLKIRTCRAMLKTPLRSTTARRFVIREGRCGNRLGETRRPPA